MSTSLLKQWPLFAFGVLGCNAVLGLDDRTFVEGGTGTEANGASTGSADAGSAGKSSGSSGASAGLSASGSVAGTGPPTDGGPDATEESTSGPQDSSTDVNPVCIPGSAGGTLPFVVDSVYSPTGIFGTGTAATSDSCSVARSSATAKGACHSVIYTSAGASSFAGVFWQDDFNWGTQGGYMIPPGATKITFSAMGQAGGEQVSFIAG